MSGAIRVLIIEDDECTWKAIRQSLEVFGFQAHWAGDGPTGLKLAHKIKPAFILLDWMMLEMDGLEVLSELKRGRKTKDLPVFMLTSRGTIGDLEQAFEMGADDYFIKPLDLTELGEMIYNKWEESTNALSDGR